MLGLICGSRLSCDPNATLLVGDCGSLNYQALNTSSTRALVVH